MTDINNIKADLYLTYKYLVSSNYANDVPAPHIKEISRYLMALWTGELDKHLAISVPPRHSKSSLVTLAYVAWLIMQNPTLRIMIITNSGTLSERFGLRLRDIFRRNNEFIGVDLSEAKQAKTDFYFAYPEGYKDPETGQDLSGEMTDGHVFITSKGGSVTGHDVDVLIIDDPYNGTDDLTPSALQKTINWFNEIVSQRIEPHTKFLILHTRWNAYDLIGYFEKTIPDDFIFLKYPAIDENGNVLWKERFNIDDFKKQQKIMGDAMFQAIYQQKPLDLSTDFFNMDKIHWVHENGNGHPLANGMAHVVMKCRSWDISSKTGRENDFTAGVPVYRLNTGDVLITDFIYGKFGETSDEKMGKLGTTDIIKRTTVHDGVGMIQCLELPGTSGDLLFTEYNKLLPGYRLHHSDHKNMPKPDRATPFRDKVEAGKVYVYIKDPKIREIFMKELSGFPNAIHDDIVDAISHAINYLFNYFDQRIKGDQVAFFV
jgi:phage terminase large subunit-like protein